MSTKLLHGDCLELMPSLPDNSVDMVLCDLPYGTTACEWDAIIPFDRLWKEYGRIVKDGGAILLFGVEPFSSTLRLSRLPWYKYDLIWEKSKSGSAFTAKFRPLARHENISVFSKGGGKTTYNPQLEAGTPYSRRHGAAETKINNHKLGFAGRNIVSVNDGFRYPGSVLFFPQQWRRQDQVHPTQKPVDLLRWLIYSYSNPGDTVLDNTMGSGSTGIAAVMEHRSFIGIELEQKYYDVAVRRIKEAEAEIASRLF